MGLRLPALSRGLWSCRVVHLSGGQVVCNSRLSTPGGLHDFVEAQFITVRFAAGGPACNGCGQGAQVNALLLQQPISIVCVYAPAERDMVT
jgi:hypothetical protein